MRIEYEHRPTGRRGERDIPPGANPVRLGEDARSHLSLPGLPALAIDGDARETQAWRLWNLADEPVRVGPVTLARKHDHITLDNRLTHVTAGPYLVTVILSDDDRLSDNDAYDRLDRLANDFLRMIHRDLVALHVGDPVTKVKDGESLPEPEEALLFRLEEETVELAARSPEFPGMLGRSTVLGRHLAGAALRSDIIRRLIKELEADSATSVNRPPPNWKRFVGNVPELEDERERLVSETITQLWPDSRPGLTDCVETIDRSFRHSWERTAVSPALVRYLAIRRLCREIKDLWFGFGPLEELLDDPAITEIMVLDAERIFIEKRNRLERSGRRFLTDPVTIAQRILNRAHRTVNTGTPMADARLPCGSRVNVIIPPLALSGPTITIRRFPDRPITAERLVTDYGSMTWPVYGFLEAVVKDRRNILVSGGTGTGKTTFLNALSQFIPAGERIVTVEDTAELRVRPDGRDDQDDRRRHVVTLQSRAKGLEGHGEVTIRQLVRNALRMRPDRIVVGECRGGEAIDMLQAMNTGHDGSMSTIHANSPDAVLERLIVLVQQDADTDLPVATVLRQIAGALDLIVQLGEQVIDGQRHKVVTAVSEVRGYDAERQTVDLVPLFVREGDGALEPTGSLPSFLPRLIEKGLVGDPVRFLGLEEEGES